MDRRKLLSRLGIGIGALLFSRNEIFANSEVKTEKKSILRIAHITDIHITTGDCSNRFLKCLEKIKTHNVDFFLNGGDTIMDASASTVERDQVKLQWEIWQKLRNEFANYPMYSCLGNHDMWWNINDKTDMMYGKDFAVKQLAIPNRYYSFKKGDWFFIILDSNNENAGSLDKQQMLWLESELSQLPTNASILIMSHYPILNSSTILVGGNHTDSKQITKLFYKHKDKSIHCISGHVHLLDKTVYNNVNYYCNGAISGFWWGDGDQDSAQKYWYHQTPPGYAIIDLYEDGTISNVYYPHNC